MDIKCIAREGLGELRNEIARERFYIYKYIYSFFHPICMSVLDVFA